MLHGKKAKKFGREKGVRVALLRSLAISLIKNGKIETTEAKAKELRKFVEPLVTIAKKGEVAGRRLVASRLGNNETETKKLFVDVAPKYKEVAGGYTRIIKLKARLKDSAKLAVIEFV
jgi:large subunit ribosomal protein L17